MIIIATKLTLNMQIIFRSQNIETELNHIQTTLLFSYFLILLYFVKNNTFEH
jgi:hypothetical protein